MRAILLRTTLLLAVLIAAVLYGIKDRFAFDFRLLFGANIFLALVTILSGILSSRGNAARPASFINSVYSGTLLRLFLVAGGAAVYIITNKGKIDTRSLLLAGALYIVYTGVETFVLQKATRKNTPPPTAK